MGGSEKPGSALEGASDTDPAMSGLYEDQIFSETSIRVVVKIRGPLWVP